MLESACKSLILAEVVELADTPSKSAKVCVFSKFREMKQVPVKRSTSEISLMKAS